jgi:2-polyprenyl-6-hydroxyphenyl methylase/3-demethylubiquinone-9 3-methyltransferase
MTTQDQIRAVDEIRSGERFQFGANWSRFLQHLNEERIKVAEQSLSRWLETERLDGMSFLDIGSGSGLFSLAARRLGARVHSFDYDPQSVACTAELRRRYYADDPNWKVESGSVLDQQYLSSLGQFEIVYSWGVLHHMGAMWQALGNVAPLVAPGGKLFIAIYNDQGGTSRRWLMVKRLYNRLPRLLRPPFAAFFGVAEQLRPGLAILLRGENPLPFSLKSQDRGMAWWSDVVDWVGGYPFEVARPEEIFDFYRARGFTLLCLKTKDGGHGYNEFVFQRASVG